MSKTILAQVDGFTPLIDGVVMEVGLVSAAVFGKAWRFCQMSDGVCKAAQDRIANELGISRATVNTHMAILTEAGYLEDTTPNLLGLPHVYRDTGKANLSISLTGSCQNGLQGGVKNFDTKKEVKKEVKKTTTTTPTAEAIAKFNAFTLYEENIGPLTPLISESITGLISDYTEEWVNRAIQEAAISNVRNIKYISAVCAGYKERGSPDIGRDKTQYGKGKQYGNQQTPKQVQAEPTAADLAIAARIKAQRAVAVQ